MVDDYKIRSGYSSLKNVNIESLVCCVLFYFWVLFVCLQVSVFAGVAEMHWFRWAIAITGRELSSSIQIDEYCIVLVWLCFEWFAKQLGKNAPLSNFCTFLKIYFFYHAMNLRRGAKSLVLGV